MNVGDSRLATTTWGSGPPDIVLLHDGLGSVAQWRDVPERIATTTGRTVMAYDRAGHGRSTPTPVGPWPADWLHREAVTLGRLIEEIGADRPLLVGHSDGASIALIHAADSVVGDEAGRYARASAAVTGVISLAAHAYVEAVTVNEIRSLRSNAAAVSGALERFHAHPEAIVEAWSGAWVGDDFAGWDIRPILGEIDVTVMAVQGEEDEYASPDHLDEIVRAIGSNATGRLVPGVRHLIHHDAPDLVVSLVVEAIGM